MATIEIGLTVRPRPGMESGGDTAVVRRDGGRVMAAIVDVLDTELMDSMIAAEVLLNRAVYADDFLKAYRA